jgi:pilus assembly protein Flp/PilA
MQSPRAVTLLKRLANGDFCRLEEGQDLLEYALLVALISLIAVGAVTLAGGAVNTIFSTIANALSNAA